ncbi:MAG: recombinase RecA, partial [Clostridia bacterium]
TWTPSGEFDSNNTNLAIAFDWGRKIKGLDSGEQALDIVETLVRSNAVDIIVIDSVAALTPQAEIDGDMGDSHVGLIARLMSQALRKLTAIASKSKCTIIFINQLRDKIGVTYGSPETTTGGKALKFYSSVRIDIRKSDSVKDGADITGNRIKAKIVKNKIAPPFKVAEFDIMYGTGISQIGCVLDLAAANNIILKSGSWYSYKDEKIGQGRDKSIEFLTNHKELAQDIEKQVRAKYDL